MAIPDRHAAVALARQYFERNRLRCPLPEALKRTGLETDALVKQVIGLLSVADASLSPQELHHDLTPEFPTLRQASLLALLEHLGRLEVVASVSNGRNTQWQLAPLIPIASAKPLAKGNAPLSEVRVRLRNPLREDDWHTLAGLVYKEHPAKTLEAFIETVRVHARSYGYDLSVCPDAYRNAMLNLAYKQLNRSQ